MRINKRMIVSIIICVVLLLNASPVFAGELFDIAAGTYQGTKNTLNLSYPWKGDIYFGGNTGGLYGTYTHTALARDTTYLDTYAYDETLYGGSVHAFESGYGWTGLTIECTPTSSYDDTISRDAHRFWYYDWAAEGYVNNRNSTQKNAAVTKALTYYGWYDWKYNFNYAQNDSWSCSKLVSRAYYDTSALDLGWFNGNNVPIYPDHIYFDPNVTIYTTSSAVSKLDLPEHAIERMNMWKQKGVDTSDVSFQSGINKKGIGKFFDRLLNDGVKKEEIKSKYKIDDQQIDQMIKDSKNTIL